MVFWSFGMCVAFLGPTILDLGCQTGKVFSTMSWVFFSQTASILVGSACGGWLSSKLSKHCMLLVSVCFMAASLSIIPQCQSLAPLAIILAIMGFFMGIVDTLANLSMIELYGSHVGPFLQALHFFYGLGAFVAPMIVEPFLFNVDCTSLIEQVPSGNTSMTAGPNRGISVATAVQNSRVRYAFWILASIQLPVLLLLLAVVVRDWIRANAGTSTCHIQALQNSDKNRCIESHSAEAESGLKWTPTFRQMVLLTVSTALLLFLVDSLQAIYGSFVYSYSIKMFETIRSSSAAYLNAAFWGSFALGRLVSIPISAYSTPQVMLLGNIGGSLFSVILLLTFRKFQTILYAGTVLIGLFLSSVYPSSISLVETYSDITPSITTVCVVSAAAGEMFMPVIVGHEFSSFGPTSFLVSLLILTILASMTYAALILLGNSFRRRVEGKPEVGVLRGIFSRTRKSALSCCHGDGLGQSLKHVNFYSRVPRDGVESDSPTQCS
jgi:fucose permease